MAYNLGGGAECRQEEASNKSTAVLRLFFQDGPRGERGVATVFFLWKGKRGIDDEGRGGNPPGDSLTGIFSLLVSESLRGGRRIFYLTNLSPCVIRGSTWHKLTG